MDECVQISKEITQQLTYSETCRLDTIMNANGTVQSTILLLTPSLYNYLFIL